MSEASGALICQKKYEVAGQFLEDDVQSLQWTRELRRLIAEFRANSSHEPWDGTGNAWTLYLAPEGARIELALFDDFEPSLELSLEELDEILAGWERLLVAPRE